MDTHEFVLREYFLKVLQRKQSRDATLCRMESHILVLPLDEKQVVVVDLIQLVVGLHRDEVVGTADGVVRQVIPFRLGQLGTDGLVDSLDKTGKVEWLQQIVDHREVEGIDGILGISRSEDDGWLMLKTFNQLKACEVGHLDVEKHDVDLIVFQGVHGFKGIRACGHQLQRVHLRHIILQELLSQVLIIHNNHIILLFHSSILTLYISLSC